MGWFDGFPFKSKEQTAKERKDFENRVFPLGEDERKAVILLLREISMGRNAKAKVHDNERLFAFISAKDKYTQYDKSDKGLDYAKTELARQNWLTEKDHNMLLAFVKLEANIEKLEDMPTIEMIKASSLNE